MRWRGQRVLGVAWFGVGALMGVSVGDLVFKASHLQVIYCRSPARPDLVPGLYLLPS